MLKVGMAGIGGISGAHIPAWESMADTELIALCDIRPECLEKYPDKHLYTDLSPCGLCRPRHGAGNSCDL